MAAEDRTTVRHLLLAALLLSACRSFSPPLPGVAEQARGAVSISARLRVSLRGPETRGRATALVALRRPDALRVEVPGPSGPRVTLVAGQGRVLAAFPADRAYWEGDSSAGSLEALLGVALTPAEVMDLLVGLPPASVRDYRASWGPSVPRKVTATLADGSRLVVTVEDAELDGELSPRAFEDPSHAGYRLLTREELRSLWR
jgi:hypothetical protein